MIALVVNAFLISSSKIVVSCISQSILDIGTVAIFFLLLVQSSEGIKRMLVGKLQQSCAVPFPYLNAAVGELGPAFVARVENLYLGLSGRILLIYAFAGGVGIMSFVLSWFFNASCSVIERLLIVVLPDALLHN